MNVSSTHRFSGWRGLNQTQVYSLRIDHKVGTTHTPTLRLVLERGCDESVNLQLSVPSVSALAWGSGMSRDAPPDDGKIPKERGRSLLGRLKKKLYNISFYWRTDHKRYLSMTCDMKVAWQTNLCALTWLGRLRSTRRSRWSVAFWSSPRAPCNYGSSAEFKAKTPKRELVSHDHYSELRSAPPFLSNLPLCAADGGSCIPSSGPALVLLTCQLKQRKALISLSYFTTSWYTLNHLLNTSEPHCHITVILLCDH